MDHKDVCFEIENDDFFRQFLTNTNKPVNKEKEISASEKIEKLKEGIEKLNLELESQVLSKHHDLLIQASHASNLEKVIGSMQLEAHGLLTGIEKLRSQILIPYEMLQNQTAILGRVQKVCHIMRQVLKIIELSKGLKLLDKNPSLQANLVYEIEQIINDGDFEGIDILVDELNMIKNVKFQILENATKQLHKGLNNGDKSMLLLSFNIFNNLHCAKENINDIITAELNTVTQNIQNALNVQQSDAKKSVEVTKVGPGKANIMNSQILKQCLWENIEKLFDEHLFTSCKKIILLQNSLNDLHSFENFRFVAKGFWDKLSNTFSSELKKSPAAVNQCIEIDYPRLLKCYNELCTKLHYKQFSIKRDTLITWENSFLSKSLAKLLDPVRAMWQVNHTPNLEQVDEAIRAISFALSISLGDKQLSVALATSVAKCIKQMSTEAEQRVCVDADAGQVIETPTSSQQRNADLSNILYYFSKQINRVLSNMLMVLSAESINIIQESLKDISSVSVLQPFCISINGAIDLILASMHNEIENRVESTHVSSCSLYMRELQQFITRCRDIYLSMYEDSFAVNKCCEEIAIHCIMIFIYNVCCLRPMSDYRRQKLKFDCKQLISILNSFVSNPNSRIPISNLLALHRLLEMSPSITVVECKKNQILPYSLIMLLLFSFASSDLQSPHQYAGWSHQKLIQWLYEHQSERERIEFIATALQRYLNHVNQNNLTKYDDIYPMLIQILDLARASTK